MEFEKEIGTLLRHSGLVSRGEAELLSQALQLEQLAPDGSNRKFYRISQAGSSLCLAVAPATEGNQELKEARSTWMIGRHLEQKKIPVPKMYAWDRESGLILFEDLGDIKLYDLVMKEGRKPDQALSDELKNLYRQAVEVLAAMQISGREDFDTSWCWDTKRYDEELRFSREAMYCLESFLRDMLGCDISGEVVEECREIARLGQGEDDFFLHRDFQSRNIMIREGLVRIIDFQGGRLGPLGYDLASLLIDPYVALSEQTQEEMVSLYIDCIGKNHGGDGTIFLRNYSFLALQRNLQILGAFSFLYRVRDKSFFKQFIAPSTRMLQKRLSNIIFSQFTSLRKSVDKAVLLVQEW